LYIYCNNAECHKIKYCLLKKKKEILGASHLEYLPVEALPVLSLPVGKRKSSPRE
jgi:hypothetical protein